MKIKVLGNLKRINHVTIEIFTSIDNNKPTTQATPWTDEPLRSLTCYFQSSNSKIKYMAIKRPSVVSTIFVMKGFGKPIFSIQIDILLSGFCYD